MTTIAASTQPRPGRRAVRVPPPANRPWDHLTARQRLDRLLAASAPLGHDLSALTQAETLYALNVRFGLVPPPEAGDPPVGYVQDVARALRQAAYEHGDMRGATAIGNALADFNLGMRPLDSAPAGWEVVYPARLQAPQPPHDRPPRACYVASSSAARRCYLVHRGYGCGCTAARCGHECRHEQLIQVIAAARERWAVVQEALRPLIASPPPAREAEEPALQLAAAR